ncbi:MAG: c-type cytochrome [Candidatus Methylomirabilales bacterium]
MRQREQICLGLVLLLMLTAWQGPARAGGEPGQHAKSQMHHPKGWRFTLPQGDTSKGREVFAKFECYSCHQVIGEDFPDPGGEAVGPELRQMGPMHPPEYFTESIMNPSAVLGEDQYRAEDGGSKMPNFNDIMTVEELIDLAAFLKSLGGEHSRPSQGKHGH